jgi:hypothetical protein
MWHLTFGVYYFRASEKQINAAISSSPMTDEEDIEIVTGQEKWTSSTEGRVELLLNQKFIHFNLIL